MIKLLFYMGIFILACYLLDFLWLKWIESIKDLKKAYIDLKKAKQDLEDFLK